MSKFVFRTTTNTRGALNRDVEVTIGLSPNNGLYMVVDDIDDDDDPDYIYNHKDDPELQHGASPTIEFFLKRAVELGVQIPSEIISSIEGTMSAATVA